MKTNELKNIFDEMISELEKKYFIKKMKSKNLR